MQIDFSYDSSVSAAPAGFKAALQAAANYLDGLIQNNITVTIAIGWGEVGGAPVTNGLADSAPYGGVMSYSQVVQELTKVDTSAEDQSFVDSLPATNPTNGGSFLVSDAQEQAWGLLPASVSTAEGEIGFNSSAAFSFNPNDPTGPNEYDFIATAEAEITHVLGRFASLGKNPPGYYQVMDLLRYTSGHQLDVNGTSQDYLSLDGGKTLLLPFDTTADAGDWAESVQNDAFGYGFIDQVETISATDIQLLGAIGFDVGTPSAAPKPTPIMQIARGPDGSVTDAAGNTWAIDSNGQITVNGAVDSTTAHVEMLVYNNGTIWQENASDQWYDKTSATASWQHYTGSGAPVTFPTAQSAAGTVITAAGTSIQDAMGNLWSINNGQVVVDGFTDTSTRNVIELEYLNGRIWQENSSHDWWSKTTPGGAWIGGSAPTATAVAAANPSATPAGGGADIANPGSLITAALTELRSLGDPSARGLPPDGFSAPAGDGAWTSAAAQGAHWPGELMAGLSGHPSIIPHTI